MNLVTSLQRTYNDWLIQKELPKWLSGFLSNRLPQFLTLVLIVLIAQRVAELTWRLIPDPPAPQLPVQQQIPQAKTLGENPLTDKTAERIASLHLFGRAGEVKPVIKEEVNKKAPETTLRLTLHGVFVEQQPEAGAAIIGKAGAKQNYYRVGSSVMNGVKLQAVFNDRVVLLRNGRSEVLKFPKTVKPGPVPESLKTTRSAQASKAESLSSYRDIFRNEPLKIFEHVRFVPVRSGKTVKGYRVLPQRNRKLYNQLGIRPSDLVTSVNGVPLQNDKEALQLIDKLKDANQINLEIVRRGQTESLTISLD
ncbi:MAG: type II secretion system protein GspC [Gammaproteobacteria bacterium]|nr:type II secretion system protein GspC [Gammaproteobacteria bacterium]